MHRHKALALSNRIGNKGCGGYGVSCWCNHYNISIFDFFFKSIFRINLYVTNRLPPFMRSTLYWWHRIIGLQIVAKLMSAYFETFKLGKTYKTPKGDAVIVKNFNLKMKKGEFASLLVRRSQGNSLYLAIKIE